MTTGMIQPKIKAEDPRKNDVRIARDVEEIEVTVNQSLGAHDPETDRGQSEHDRVMDRDAETERDEIKQNGQRSGTLRAVAKRNDDHDRAEERVDHAVETELFR